MQGERFNDAAGDALKDLAIRSLHWLTDQVHHQPPLYDLQMQVEAGEITQTQADESYANWWHEVNYGRPL